MELRAIVQPLRAVDKARNSRRGGEARAAPRPLQSTVTILLCQFRRAQRFERLRHAPVAAWREHCHVGHAGSGPFLERGPGRDHSAEHAAKLAVADEDRGLR